MKVFSVSKSCNACGECVLRTKLLSEDSGGFAIPTPGLYIQDVDLPDAQRVVAQCPAHALSIVEQSSVASKGKAGLEELAKILEQRLKAVKIPDIGSKDVAYHPKDYEVDYGYISEEGRKTYPTERKAKDVGNTQFERVFWNRRTDFVLNILTQYKSKVLRKYFDLSVPERTFYAEIGEKMMLVLSQVEAEAHSLSGGNISLPEDFSKFHPELNDRAFKEYVQSDYTKWLFMPSYATDFCDRLAREEYYSKKYYEGHIITDWESTTQYDSRGRAKKTLMYSFEGANEEGREMVNDILSYLDSGDIEDFVMLRLKDIMERYRRLFEQEIAKKITEFKDAINKC